MTSCFTGCLELDALYGNILGTDGDDTLIGNALFNKISGLGGRDTIMGGGLLDNLNGGDGIDTVSYDNACAAVTVDLNITGWQWTGGSFFDKLSGFENITGSKYNDTLIGTAGDNRITGGLGKDTMIGGAGNDIYSVDNVGDKVVEKAGEGVDLVMSSISYTLGANVENLALFGTAITGTGNNLDNIIRGNELDNIIAGKGGSDSLYGGAGKDTFMFESTSAADISRVRDFVSGTDKVAFKGSAFGIATGALNADWMVFAPNTAPQKDGTNSLATSTTHGQFIFDMYHNLWWDADGAGTGAATLIGGFGTSNTVLGDFVVV